MKKLLYLFILSVLFCCCSGPALNSTSSSNKNRGSKLFPVNINNYGGFMNEKGEIVIEPKFDAFALWVDDGIDGIQDRPFFSDGLARVRKNGEWMFIDSSGNIVIDLSGKLKNVGWVDDFHDGLALYKPGGKQINLLGLGTVDWIGFIDKKGNKVLEPEFEEATAFMNGLAYVSTDRFSHSVFINKRREVVTSNYWPPEQDFHPVYNDHSNSQYHDANTYNKNHAAFSEGLAVVQTDSLPFVPDSTMKEFPYINYIDTTGKIVFKNYFYDAHDFKNGYAVVATDWMKFGCIDKKGKVIIEPKYSFLGDFCNGLAPFVYDRSVKINAKEFKYQPQYGYLDMKGNVVISGDGDTTRPEKGFAYPPEEFSEGMAAVQKNKKWGFIDTTGKLAIDYKFYDVGKFENGLAWFVLQDTTWVNFKRESTIKGYIDKSGKVIWMSKH